MIGEFATRLRELGAVARLKDAWLMVGEPTRVAAWKLHLSVTPADIDRLFERVLPRLVHQGAHFKMVADRISLVRLGAGDFGAAQIGKTVTVYPRNDREAVALARDLIDATRGIVGPAITTDLHLGEAVYARYGAVRPRIVHDRLGEPTELIPDGSGNWIVDPRSVPFACPPGIANPFCTASDTTADAPPGPPGLLGGRYLVTDILRPGLTGSVLRAIDLGDRKRVVACVLKQAHAHCAEDEARRDLRVRLRHEALVLARLRGLKGIVSAGEYFEEEETGYLPMTYVRGRTLAEIVYRCVTGRSWRCVPSHARHRLLSYSAQLVRRLRCAHARGVIHRDVSPGNVWIADDDRVYLLDWECAHRLGSRRPVFPFGTPGFSDSSPERRAPAVRDDWQACGRVIVFILTGLDPAAVVHGTTRELATRLAAITGLHDARLNELLARALSDDAAEELQPGRLLRAIASMTPGVRSRGNASRVKTSEAPLFTPAKLESVLAQGMEMLSAGLRDRLERLGHRRKTLDAGEIDAHSGIAGLLYVLAAAHGARFARLNTGLAERATRVLTGPASVTPDLPGLVRGTAGRALAVAAALQAGCVVANEATHRRLGAALAGCLDWPDFTHGAAGQGFAALACASRLRAPEFAAHAAACAAHLIRTQSSDGAWTLPAGAPGASGERFTGLAHGAAGMMGFLGRYAALARDVAADRAWRRAENWLVNRARRGRGGRWHWPQSDSRPAPGHWWCHGAPGIALGWLCVARALGTAAIAEEPLRRALASGPLRHRSDNLGQCHGLAGIGEVYLEAHQVLQEETWLERAADIATGMVAMYRGRSHPPWHYPTNEPAAGADGLLFGTAGILHFLLRYRYPDAVSSAPLMG